MPSIPLHPSPLTPQQDPPSPLPHLLQTPGGLSILEIQGTLHIPTPSPSDNSPQTETEVGRLQFPFYDPTAPKDDVKWMKRVYLYVGKHQRLTGEVKKLPKPLGVIRKCGKDEIRQRKRQGLGGNDVDMQNYDDDNDVGDEEEEGGDEELEIVDVIEYRILFGGRPEPVGE